MAAATRLLHGFPECAAVEPRPRAPAFRAVACASGIPRPAPASARSCRSLQHERYRPVVDELHLHHRAETSCRHFELPLAERGDKALVEWNGGFRSCRIYERWPAALLRITVQRELRNHENFAVNLG